MFVQLNIFMGSSTRVVPSVISTTTGRPERRHREVDSSLSAIDLIIVEGAGSFTPHPPPAGRPPFGRAQVHCGNVGGVLQLNWAEFVEKRQVKFDAARWLTVT